MHVLKFYLIYFEKFLCLEYIQYNGFFMKSFLISPAGCEVAEKRKEGRRCRREKRRCGEREGGKEVGKKERDELENRKEVGRKESLYVDTCS